MDKMSVEVVQALTILLPGFLVVGVIRSLFSGEQETESDKVSRALVYSFVVYVIFVVGRVAFGKSGWNLEIARAFPTNTKDIMFLFVISLSVGALVALYKHHDWHSLFRKIKITDRSCRTTVWNDVFIDKTGSYVCVEFQDGRRLFGWPEYYSDDPST